MILLPPLVVRALDKQKHGKGIGNRSAAGNGATWVGDRYSEPRPRTQRKERVRARELRPLPNDLGDGDTHPISGRLRQIGDWLLEVGRFLAGKLLRPSGQALAGRWRAIREKIGTGERLIDSDTYEPGRVRDWEKFQQGKRSTSYLRDDDSDDGK